MYEAQAGNEVQQLSIEGALIIMKPDSAPSDRSDDTGRSETMSAVLDYVFLIMELFKGGTWYHVKQVVELLHCDNFYVKVVNDNVSSVTS